MLRISKYYEEYENLRFQLLNHPKIIEYLFNKPLEKHKFVGDLTFDFDCTVKTVMLSSKDNLKIGNFFIYMDEQISKYNKVYKNSGQYKSHFDKQFFIPLEKLSDPEKKIYHIMEKLGKKYELYCFSKWKFKVEGEHTSLGKLPTINFDLNISCDFFCCMLYKHQLHLFVIEYDSNSHHDVKSENFIKIHLNDLLKQHYLFQMNIHLLRLNKDSDIKKEIKNFIKEVIEGSNYVISGQIEPMFKFRKPICGEYLKTFNTDYAYNHNIYLKIAARSKNIDHSKEELEVVLVGKNKEKKHKNSNESEIDSYDDIENNIHYQKEPCDLDYVITNDIMEEILTDKEYFKVPTKQDFMFDDLVGMYNQRKRK